MTYIRTSRKPSHKSAQAIIAACAAVAVVMIGVQLLAPYFLPSLFTTVALPFWRMEFSVENGSLNSPQALLAQNEDLKRKLAALEVSQQSVQATIVENSELLALLGRTDSSLSSTTASLSYLKSVSGRILAAVLMRPPISSYDELIIDIGADHGVVLGAQVYAPGNVLIGTTTDVFSQTAKVTLFSSPGETYPVLIGPGRIPATAVGLGGGQYEAEVPQAAKVSQGDVVSDSLLGDAPFGMVTAILTDPASPFETVLFAPPVNVYQLRWVLVETPTKKISN